MRDCMQIIANVVCRTVINNQMKTDAAETDKHVQGERGRGEGKDREEERRGARRRWRHTDGYDQSYFVSTAAFSTRTLCTTVSFAWNVLTRSSAVAVIADRTAYDVRFTGKPSNRFLLQVDERLVYARSDSTGRVYERTQTLSTQAWPLSVGKQSSVGSQWITERNTTSARPIVCLKKAHVRVFFDSLFSVRFVAKRYMLQQSVWKDK